MHVMYTMIEETLLRYVMITCLIITCVCKQVSLWVPCNTECWSLSRNLVDLLPSMDVCLCVGACVNMCMYMYKCTCVYVYVCVVDVSMYAYACVCVCACTCVHSCVCMHVCVCVWVHTCMCAYFRYNVHSKKVPQYRGHSIHDSMTTG